MRGVRAAATELGPAGLGWIKWDPRGAIEKDKDLSRELRQMPLRMPLPGAVRQPLPGQLDRIYHGLCYLKGRLPAPVSLLLMPVWDRARASAGWAPCPEALDARQALVELLLRCRLPDDSRLQAVVVELGPAGLGWTDWVIVV